MPQTNSASPQRMLQGRRWLVVAVASLLANVLAVVWLLRSGVGNSPGTLSETPLGAAPNGAFYVAATTPERGGTIETTGAIRFRFSQDVSPHPAEAPLRAASAAHSSLVSIDPPTPGRTRWVGTRTLEFEPDRPWKRATAYIATLTPAFDEAVGHTLEGPRAVAFSTRPVRLWRVRQTGFTPELTALFELSFTDRVDPVEVRKRLTLLDPLDQPIPYTFEAAVPGETLTLRTGAVNADGLSFEIAPGLKGAEGDLATTEMIRTKADVSFRLRLMEVEAEFNPHGDSTIRASFNSSIDGQRALSFLRLEPSVPCRAESVYGGLLLRGPFRAGSRCKVTFLKGLGSTEGHLLTADVTRFAEFADACPELRIDAGGEVLSTASDLIVPVETVNVGEFTVDIDRVYPNNRIVLLRSRGRYELPADLSQRLVSDRRITVDSPRNTAHTTNLDLRELLGPEAHGTLWIGVRGTDWRDDSQIVTITDLGVVVKRSAHDLLVWVNSLRTLEPAAAATVEVFSRTNQCLVKAGTDAAGLARFEDVVWHDDRTPFAVVVTHGEETVALPLDASTLSTESFEVTGRPFVERGYEAFVYGDRGAYRPGETVHLVADVRDAHLASPEPFPVEFVILRPDGRTFRVAAATLSRFGTAEISCDVPTSAPTGTWTANVRLPGATANLGATRFLIEEFVPPQIHVALTTDEGRRNARDPLRFEVQARYLFGAPAADARVEGAVTFTPEEFRPTAWPGYLFGDTDRGFARGVCECSETKTDPKGAVSLKVAPSVEWRPPAALKATIRATVHDLGGRAVSAYATRSVDVYPAYVGIHSPDAGTPIEVGKPARYEVVVVDPSGAATDRSTVDVTLFKEVWTWCLRSTSGRRYDYSSSRELVEVQKSTIPLSGGRGVFEFTPGESGQFRLRVALPGTEVASAVSFWINAPDAGWNAWSMEKPDRIDLAFDRPAYRPGETAHLLVKAPFAGKALVTVETNRVREARVETFETNTRQLDFTVPPGESCNLYCSVTLIRTVAPEEVWRPHRAFGVASLTIDDPARKLAVTLDSPEEIRPGTHLAVPIAVTDGSGAGVEAEVTVSAVDEGICMLTGFASPNPLAFFTSRRALGVSTSDVYGRLMPERRKPAAGSPSSEGGDGEEDEKDGSRRPDGIRLDSARLNPIPARRFKPVALWSGRVTTDAQGHGQAEFDIPDFNGSLRLSAVAVGIDRFGSTRRDLLVRAPLVVRSSLPRILAPGDVFKMPIEIFNRGAGTGAPAIELLAEGCVEVVDPPTLVTLKVPHPAGETVIVRDPIARGPEPRTAGTLRAVATLRALQAAGSGKITLRCRLGGETSEETTEIAVRPAAPFTTLAGCGSVSAGETARLKIPGGWLHGTGKREIVGTSNPAAMLARGLDYVARYPYGCIEQSVSSAFPLLYLADLTAGTQADGAAPLRVEAKVMAGIDRVLSMQTCSGGFSMWPGERREYEWGTLYAAHFLVEARIAGYDVPEGELASALRHIEQSLERRGGNRDEEEERDRETMRAYATLIFALHGQPRHAWMEILRDRRDTLDAESIGFLAAAYVAAGQPAIATALLSGPLPSANVDRDQEGLLRSSTRMNAVLLSAWVAADPTNGAIPELVKRLEATRTRGRWGSTQENAFAILALGKLSRALVRSEPHFTTEVRTLRETLAKVASEGPLDVRLHDEAGESVELAVSGAGALYYSWISEGVPADGHVEEADRGVQIRRRVLDRSGTVADLTRVRCGDTLVVELRTEAPQAIPNAVIEDLLPAGLEVENPRLETSERDGSDVAPRAPSFGPCVDPDHVELRDDRVLVFTTIQEGTQVYRYLVRAVTSGHFAVPAASVSAMYDEEVWSRSGAGVIEIGE